MTLYRKYRPQTIEELDLESVRETLEKLSANVDKLPHAFLFAGPRGSGKTSAARILAKLANCENPVEKNGVIEPCNKCSQCKSIMSGSSMDVIEMDAASNRGIDDIRSLRESISLAPSNAKKKIYILDEAHMLTNEAANAFLKTLEEPPEHAVFILATTDPHRLPETVRSRLTTIIFRKAKSEEILRQLNRVVEGEKMDLEDGVIELLSKNSDGSFRDAVKALEALSVQYSKIRLENAKNFLFQTNTLSANEFVDLLTKMEVKNLLQKISEFSNKGGSTKDLIDRTIDFLRSNLLAEYEIGNKTDNLNINREDAVLLIKQLMEARDQLQKTNISQLPLELLVMNWCSGSAPDESQKSDSSLEDKKEEVQSRKEISKKKDFKPADTLDDGAWNNLLNSLREDNASIETLLRAARPVDFDGKTLNVEVYYRFHKERLESQGCRSVLEKKAGEIFGKSAIKVLCTLADPPENLKRKPEVPLTVNTDDDIIQAAKEIFGN